jgi:hypothetical protein
MAQPTLSPAEPGALRNENLAYRQAVKPLSVEPMAGMLRMPVLGAPVVALARKGASFSTRTRSEVLSILSSTADGTAKNCRSIRDDSGYPLARLVMWTFVEK